MAKKLVAALASLALLSVCAVSASASNPQATASASVKKTVKKLKQTVGAQQEQLAALEQQLAEVEGAPGPPSGTAGGDLAGSYPNPSIAGSAVGGPEILNGAVGILDIGNDAVSAPEITNGQVGTAELSSSIPAARVTSSLDQTFNPQNSVTFDTERYDTAGMHSNVTNNTRLTAPVAGVYAISAQAVWEANSTGLRALELFKDPVGPGGDVQIAGNRVNNVGAAQETPVEVSTVAQLGAGDFVQISATEGSGGPLDIVQSDEDSPEFTMTWLAPGP